MVEKIITMKNNIFLNIVYLPNTLIFFILSKFLSPQTVYFSSVPKLGIILLCATLVDSNLRLNISVVYPTLFQVMEMIFSIIAVMSIHKPKIQVLTLHHTTKEGK